MRVRLAKETVRSGFFWAKAGRTIIITAAPTVNPSVRRMRFRFMMSLLPLPCVLVSLWHTTIYAIAYSTVWDCSRTASYRSVFRLLTFRIVQFCSSSLL